MLWNAPLTPVGQTHDPKFTVCTASQLFLVLRLYEDINKYKQNSLEFILLCIILIQGCSWPGGAGQREVWGADGVFTWNSCQHSAAGGCLKGEQRTHWFSQKGLNSKSIPVQWSYGFCILVCYARKGQIMITGWVNLFVFLQVKADKDSSNLQRLQHASRGVTQATAAVVASTKSGKSQIEETGEWSSIV